MNRKIMVFGFIFVLLAVSVSAQDLYADIYLNADRDLYANINLDGEQKNVNIDGVNYKGYVEEYYIRNTGSPKKDTINMFDRVIDFLIYRDGRLSTDYSMLANSLANLLNYVVDDIYSRWILPTKVRQDAIIETLDQEVYCKSLAKHYFKAYQKDSFVCEYNNKTYYDDVNYAIQIN